MITPATLFLFTEFSIFFISVPSLWKDSLSLENIANDFLESNVTGEVMNLDDFLKELQVRKAEPMVVMTVFCYNNGHSKSLI
jgi:hypothetical protein